VTVPPIIRVCSLRGQRRRTTKQQQFPLSRLGEVRVHIEVRGIGRQRAMALIGRPIDGGEIVLEDANGLGVQRLAPLIQGALQFCDGGVVMVVGEVCRLHQSFRSAQRRDIRAGIARARHPDQTARQQHQRETCGGHLRNRERQPLRDRTTKWREGIAPFSG
jgi:hypothetical protein